MARTHDAPWRVVAASVLALAMMLGGAPRQASAGGVGWVTGVVTAGGAPLAAAWVVLTPVTDTGDWAGDSHQVATDGSGRYLFEGIAPGHAKLHVRAPLTGGFVATFWPGVYTFGQAGTVPVAHQGFVADIDLPVGRSIEGRVVAQDTGEPVVGVQLIARIADAAWSEPAGRFEQGGRPGEFTIHGLPPVPVRVHVQVPQGSAFLGDGYWSDGTVTGRRIDDPGDVTGLVIRLPRGGEVSGTVRDDQGRPVPGATVRFENCQYGCPREVTTDGSGAYRVGGIAPSARMIVHAWTPGMVDQWYDGASDWFAATPIDLGPGEARSGVDFVLLGGGVLIGQVVAGDTGRALIGVPAYLQALSDPSRRYFAHFSDYDLDRYQIGPVPPGSYRLVLLPNSSQSQYWPARWQAATGIATTGIISFGTRQRAEVVVTLARSQSDPDCHEPAAWRGLFRGFLAADPWPAAASCPPPGRAPGATAVRSA